MKANTLHIKEPSKELLEFARALRSNNQEKIMKYKIRSMKYKVGDIVDIRSKVNGYQFFVITSLEPLDIHYYHKDMEEIGRRYEYDKEELLANTEPFGWLNEPKVVGNTDKPLIDLGQFLEELSEIDPDHNGEVSALEKEYNCKICSLTEKLSTLQFEYLYTVKFIGGQELFAHIESEISDGTTVKNYFWIE